MKTIETIIKAHGGLEALKEKYIRIENEPYMRLCIEYVGQGPRNWPMISVCHYGEQNGDPMRDPEMVYEVELIPATGVADMYLWRWEPISFRNDYLGLDQLAMWTDPDKGQIMVKPNLVLDLKVFARDWDRNIKEQGFLEAFTSRLAV